MLFSVPSDHEVMGGIVRNSPQARAEADLMARGERIVNPEPLGKDATVDYYRHLGAEKPYAGGFAPKPITVVVRDDSQLSDYQPDPDFDDEAEARPLVTEVETDV